MGIRAGSNQNIDGQMQLYSVDKRVSQVLPGHTGVFTTITPEGRVDPAHVLCFEDKKPDQPAQLFVMEVGREQKEGKLGWVGNEKQYQIRLGSCKLD